MKVFPQLSDWQRARQSADFAGKKIGFVPTMGALHAGHRALLERAHAENDLVVLSIFVNPTQFNDPADLQRYPRTLEADLALAEGVVDAVLTPSHEELYPDGYHYRVTENDLSLRWEGAHRPGHFDGVLTVVLKLLNVVQAHQAYFGEKDWQQLQLVRGMVHAFFVPTEIIACATERAPDGLALSSRNARLSSAGRAQAAVFPRILRESPTAGAAVPLLEAAGFGVDYVADHENIRLAAVRLEGIRLIDNVRI
jgi:pantoate--beta-alanine ligase